MGTHTLLWDHEARTQHFFIVESDSVCTPTRGRTKSKNFKWLSGEKVRGLEVLTNEGLMDSNLAYLLIFRVGAEKIVVVATGRMRKKRRGEKCRHSRWIPVWDGKTIYAITLATSRLPFSRSNHLPDFYSPSTISPRGATSGWPSQWIGSVVCLTCHRHAFSYIKQTADKCSPFAQLGFQGIVSTLTPPTAEAKIQHFATKLNGNRFNFVFVLRSATPTDFTFCDHSNFYFADRVQSLIELKCDKN